MNFIRKTLPKIVAFFPLKNRLKVVTVIVGIITPVFKLRGAAIAELNKKYSLDKGIPPVFLWCLGVLKNDNIQFKISLNKELINQAVACKKGVLLIGYHGELMPLIIPYLTNNGFNIISLGARENEINWGNNFKNEILISATSLLKVKDRLAQGEIVAVMIDTIHANAKRSIEIDTAFGKMNISNAIFKVAAHVNCEIIFLKYTFTKGIVKFKFGTSGSKDCFETITADYIKFLQD